MLDMLLHSCSNLAHVYGYNSDNGSFRDCVVSHCVQMCLLYFFHFLLFLSFFSVALVVNKSMVVITMMAYLLLIM